MSCVINNNLIKYIIEPDNYVDGWKNITKNLNLIEEIPIINDYKLIYPNKKNNELSINYYISHTTEPLSLPYFTKLTDNFKNIVSIMSLNSIITMLYYHTTIIKFNCSKVKEKTKSAIIRVVETDNEKIVLNNCNLIKVINTLIAKSYRDIILILPFKITHSSKTYSPVLTLTKYKLTISKSQSTTNTHGIFDYDDIPKFDKNKTEKLNFQIFELYLKEIEKYKITEDFSFKEFCERYINNLHKIYITIRNGKVEDFLICINDDIMKLDFYTVNNLNISQWVEFVADNDELIIFDQMHNSELLTNTKIKNIKLCENYVYMFNILPKKIHNISYAIIH